MFGDQAPEQGGLMGLLSSPMGQGLLAAGLGAMGSRGSTMQAIGRGGLLGLSTFGQAGLQVFNGLLAKAGAVSWRTWEMPPRAFWRCPRWRARRRSRFERWPAAAGGALTSGRRGRCRGAPPRRCRSG